MHFNRPATTVKEYQDLIASHTDEIIKLTYPYHKGDDDIKQLILLDIWVKSPEYNCKHAMSTTIVNLAMFAALKNYKSNKWRHRRLFIRPNEEIPVEFYEDENFDYVHKILGEQNEQMKNIINLRFWEEMTLYEIHKTLNIPLATVDNHLKKFFIRTKERLYNES